MVVLLIALAFQDVDALLKALGDEDEKVRAAATLKLQTMDPYSRAIDEKIETITEHGDPEVVSRARRVLAYRRVARQVGDLELILKQLQSRNSGVRVLGVSSLVKVDHHAVHFLLPLANDSNVYIRRSVVGRLAELATPDTMDALVSALRSDRSLRSEWPMCLMALSKAKHPFARQLTLGLLETFAKYSKQKDESLFSYDDGPELDKNLIRPAIAAAAGPFRSDRTLMILKRVFTLTEDDAVRSDIVRTIADWKEARVALRPAIVKALADKYPEWIKGNAGVLVSLKLKESLPKFRELLARRSNTLECCIVIGHLKDLKAIPFLLRTVKYGDPPDNTAAAWALGEIASKNAVPSLLEIWKKRKSSSILRALGRIGDPRAGPDLSAALRHDDEQVRYVAAEALGRMKYRPAVRFLIRRLDDIIAFPIDEHDPMKFKFNRIPVLRRDATVREAALKALEQITNQSFEGSPGEQAAAWKKWWPQQDEYR